MTSDCLFNNISSGSYTISNFSCKHKLHLHKLNNNRNATEDDKQSFSYGLKNDRSPTQVKVLIQFEDYLVTIIKESKSRKVKNEFQKMLREDMKKVQTSKNTLTPEDKTSNMYRLNKKRHHNNL